MIASACFGPPPLPPNKRAIMPHSAPKLSSTYMSFRDPADELSKPEVLQTFQSIPTTADQSCCHRRGDVKSASFRARRTQNTELVPIRTAGEVCCKHSARVRRQNVVETDVSTHFSPQVNHSNVGFAVLRDPQTKQYNARTNSLRRSLRQEPPKLSFISRWRSEGNLAQLDDSVDSNSSLPVGGRLEKCMKALSGSLKNLLQCEYDNNKLTQIVHLSNITMLLKSI